MAGEPESLDTDESLKRRRHRHWLDRLIMLSDGVFAIAATLLSLDVRGPTQWNTLGELWAGLGPQLGAYVLSFLVIAIYWLAHRRFMAVITTVDAPLTVLTLIMLGLVALLPSLTRISFGHTYGGAMVLYAALVVAIGLAMATIWGYASIVARLVPTEIPWSSRWFQLGLMVVTPPLFLVLVNVPPVTAGAAPLLLAGLFLIGWPMRMWVLKQLEGGAKAKATISETEA